MGGEIKLYLGDSLEHVRSLSENSIDALVTDPPAGISFMNKEWDKDRGGRDGWIAWISEIFKECHRVMKPGAHGLVWALPRTSHWTATALENSGFEIRDVVMHLFGSGFPKSHNLGNGFGTALKPACEHWILVRKPISEKNIAENVTKWGTGGINIDGCRVEGEPTRGSGANMSNNVYGAYKDIRIGKPHIINTTGRFPANLILDEEAGQMLDGQSGISKSSPQERNNKPGANLAMSGPNLGHISRGHDDTGGTSRFFYCAKTSKSERNAGCEELPLRKNDFQRESSGLSTTYVDGIRQKGNCGQPNGNHHPTVKPQKLMQYLCKLITPPNGTILDPFMGSGSTGMAAKALGFNFIGIEKEQDYFDIARARIDEWQS